LVEVRRALIVAIEIAVENRLHFLDGLEPSAPARVAFS
jgi:hypothetical protein